MRRRGGRRAPWRFIASWLVALWLSPVEVPAQAQPQPAPDSVQVSTQVSSQEVAVGERLVVSVTALTSQDGPSPGSPRLALEGDAEVHGPSVRSEFRMFSDGRSLRKQQGITATWTITPKTPGTLTVGPGTFQVGGSTVSGEKLKVKVRPAAAGAPPGSPGSAPPRSGRGRLFPDPFDFDPFDWLSRRRPPGMDRDLFPDVLEPQVPAELKMERAPDPTGFTRMEVTPKRVVVGEQVTLSIYAYGGRGPVNIGFLTHPSTADFLSFPIERHDIVPHRLAIGDQIFHAAKIREIALIPLKAGELTIGEAELLLSGRGYPATGPQGGFVARATPLTIRVDEPPLAGRPPGYVTGDVGRYTLTADVEPRKVQQGEFVAVTARLTGIGNVPSRLAPAENQALEWLDPVVSGNVEAKGTTVGGERVFRWTVRVRGSGSIDLGELSLPYYDAEQRRYETARASLGTIEVSPAQDALLDDSTNTTDPGDLVPRTTLGQTPKLTRPLSDEPYFWWALLGVPLGIPVLGGLERGARALLDLRRKNGPDGKSRIRELLAEAMRHEKAGELREAALLYERALYEAIELATSLKARGVLRERLSSELRERGLDPAQCEELGALIEHLETFRFAGEGDTKALFEQTERATRSLASRGRLRRPS